MSRPWLPLEILCTALLAQACGGGGGGSGDDSGGGGGGGPGFDPELFPDPAASRFRVAPAFGTPADGLASVNIEVRLVNRNGRPIAGAAVALEISGCGNESAPLPRTGADGWTRGTLASIAAEEKTLTASTQSGGQTSQLGAKTTEFLQVPAATFFVRVSGSDAYSGRSPRDAWRTLEHAFASLPPGATLHVGAGLYAGPLTLRVDSEGTAPLVVSGDRSGRMTSDEGAVVIEGAGSPWALRLLESKNVVLRGLTLRGALEGLRIQDASMVRVLDCRPQENEVGVGVMRADDLVLQDCRITANRQDGLRIADTQRVRVENNLIYGNLADGLVLLPPAIQTLVRFNTFYRNGQSHLREEGLGGAGLIEENILAEGGTDSLLLTKSSQYKTGANLHWGTASGLPSRSPVGSVEADPLFSDPFGADGILGGEGADDDDFRLLPASSAIDLGSHSARDIVLGSQESLATRTTRTDGVLDGGGDDRSTTNLGFHSAQAAARYRSLAAGGGRIVHSVPDSTRAHMLAWDRPPATLTPEILGPVLDAGIVYLEHRVSPVETKEELIAVQLNTGAQGRILVRHWNGRDWDDPALAPFEDGIAVNEIFDRRFDIEYEGRSGRALFVRADEDGVPVTRVLEHGRWGPAFQVSPAAGGAGRVRLVELVARPGTDELALVTLDDQKDLVVTLWDGTRWGVPRLLEGNTVYSPSWRPFDAAFESLSGDLLVAWGFSVFAEETRWTTLERATGEWRTGRHPSSEAIGAAVVMAADPASDQIALLLGEGSIDDDVTVSIWTGAAWVHTAELTLAGPVANRMLEVAWLGDTGVACAFFRRLGHSGTFNVAYFLPTGWRIQPDVLLPGVGRAQKLRMVSVPGSNRLLGSVLDMQGRLFAVQFDGAGFSLLNDGQLLARDFDPFAPGRAFDTAARPTGGR